MILHHLCLSPVSQPALWKVGKNNDWCLGVPIYAPESFYGSVDLAWTDPSFPRHAVMYVRGGGGGAADEWGRNPVFQPLDSQPPMHVHHGGGTFRWLDGNLSD